jgi:hypothetical protein
MVLYNPCPCPERLLRGPDHEFSQVLIIANRRGDAQQGTHEVEEMVEAGILVPSYTEEGLNAYPESTLRSDKWKENMDRKLREKGELE